MLKQSGRTTRILYSLLIIFCASIFVYQYGNKINKLNQKKSLKNSKYKMIVLGNISSISNVHKSNRKSIYYNFNYHGEYYSGSAMDNFNYLCPFDFEGKSVPILIDSLNPNTNFILFHKRDFKYFNQSYPDSLNWLFNCIEPSGSYWLSPAPISPD